MALVVKNLLLKYKHKLSCCFLIMSFIVLYQVFGSNQAYGSRIIVHQQMFCDFVWVIIEAVSVVNTNIGHFMLDSLYVKISLHTLFATYHSAYTIIRRFCTETFKEFRRLKSMQFPTVVCRKSRLVSSGFIHLREGKNKLIQNSDLE